MLAVLWACCSCVAPSEYTSAIGPRADQKRWLDESQVIRQIVQCIHAASFASAHKEAVAEYAAQLRYWYSFVSQAEEDKDAGIRALNFIRQVHFDAHGDKMLWNEVILEARQKAPSSKVAPGTPIPPNYR